MMMVEPWEPSTAVWYGQPPDLGICQLCHELIIFMTSSLILKTSTKALHHSEACPDTSSCLLWHPLNPSCHWLHCLPVCWLTYRSHDPMASLASYLLRKSHTYIRPWPPAGPLGDHMMCHSLYPKEWLKGVVATKWSRYCPLHLFKFPSFYDPLLWLFHCPFHFVLILRACAHALTFLIHLSVPYSLFHKCACQSCINIGPCPLVCSPVSLS